MIACDSYLSLFFFTLQKKLRSGAIVRFSDNSSSNSNGVIQTAIPDFGSHLNLGYA